MSTVNDSFQSESLTNNEKPCAAGLVTRAVLTVINGGGQHHIDFDPANIPEILKGYVAALLLWSAANTAIKVFIIHFYITVFGSNTSFRCVAYAAMAFPISFEIGNTLMAFLIPGVCRSTIGAVQATSTVNLSVDLIIIILPMPMIWRLQMAARRKIELTITFGLGFIVCIITLLRIILGAQIQLDDFTYDLAKLAIVTDLEPLLGITIACLPLFPPVFEKVFGAKDEPTSRNVLSSSPARLRSKDTKTSRFRSFEDSYPLTDVEGTRTENEIPGVGSHSSSLNDGCVRIERVETYRPSAIKVKQG